MWLDEGLTLITNICAILSFLEGYFKNRRSKSDYSSTFFVCSKYRKFVKKKMKEYYLLLFFIVAGYVVLEENWIQISENLRMCAKFLTSAILALTFVLTIYIGLGWIDKDKSLIDRKIKGIDATMIVFYGNHVIAFFWVIAIFVITRVHKNEVDMIKLYVYLVTMFVCACGVVYNLFMSTYVETRTKYLIKETRYGGKLPESVYEKATFIEKDNGEDSIIVKDGILLRHIAVAPNSTFFTERIALQDEPLLSVRRKKKLKKVNQMKKDINFIGAIKEWFKESIKRSLLLVIVFLYCVCCIIYKISPVLNVSCSVYRWANIFFQIGVSIIIIEVVLFFRAFRSQEDKSVFSQEVFQKHVNELVLDECKALWNELKQFEYDEKIEEDIRNRIILSYYKIREGIDFCLDRYVKVMSGTIQEKLMSILNYKDLKDLHSFIISLNLPISPSKQFNFEPLWEIIEQLEHEIKEYERK